MLAGAAAVALLVDQVRVWREGGGDRGDDQDGERSGARGAEQQEPTRRAGHAACAGEPHERRHEQGASRRCGHPRDHPLPTRPHAL
eukprot:6661168-Prymnesium_polylepis.1